MRHDPDFYRSTEWRSFRAQIKRERPICETAGCGRPTTHIDHVKSRAQGGAPFDRRNVKARCTSCHSRKTAASDGGFGNRKREPIEPKAIGCNADGTPRDPSHPWHRKG